MSITLQAQQADGAWYTRCAFTDDNKLLRVGAIKQSELEDKAHRAMDRWHGYHDGKDLTRSLNQGVLPMNKRAAKQSAARTASWLPGGTHRIAYEKRMQDKKTSAPIFTQKEADDVLANSARRSHPKPDNTVNSLVMYRAACLLLMSADLQNRKQAERLIAAADDLLGSAL